MSVLTVKEDLWSATGEWHKRRSVEMVVEVVIPVKDMNPVMQSVIMAKKLVSTTALKVVCVISGQRLGRIPLVFWTDGRVNGGIIIYESNIVERQ